VAKNKRISSDVVLVVVGIVTVVALQQCDADDGCRYVYRSMTDCESEWGVGRCVRNVARYYGPEQTQCYTNSHAGSGGGGYYGDGSGRGDKAIGIDRGGFGGASRSRFGS